MSKSKVGPPKLMGLTAVPAYVRGYFEVQGDQYPYEPTRQTVYNWVERGVGGVKLKTTFYGRRLCTTEIWINDFLASFQKQRQARSA